MNKYKVLLLSTILGFSAFSFAENNDIKIKQPKELMFPQNSLPFNVQYDPLQTSMQIITKQNNKEIYNATIDFNELTPGQFATYRTIPMRNSIEDVKVGQAVLMNVNKVKDKKIISINLSLQELIAVHNVNGLLEAPELETIMLKNDIVFEKNQEITIKVKNDKNQYDFIIKLLK